MRNSAAHRPVRTWRWRPARAFSSTVFSANTCVVWKVRLRPSFATRCGPNPLVLRPSTWMVPAVGGITPLIRLNSVLLPEPLGPMTLKISPRFTRRLTSRTARRPPNALVTPCSSTRLTLGSSAAAAW